MVIKKWDKELTEENLQVQIAQAQQRWHDLESKELRAVSVHYNEIESLIVIKLKNRAIFSFPPTLAQGLANASPEQLADVWLSPTGSSVHWESLNVDFGVPELLAGIFGTKAWMSQLEKKVKTG